MGGHPPVTLWVGCFHIRLLRLLLSCRRRRCLPLSAAQPACQRQQDQRDENGRHQHKGDRIRIREVRQRHDNGGRHIALRRAQPRDIADARIAPAYRKADQQAAGDEDQQRRCV